LSYYVKEAGDKLELAAEGKDNGFGATFQGAMVPVDSPLAPVLLKVFEKLYANGTYDAIMTKWGLEANKLDKPGINRSAEK
jgi:polar amino acid transport system substrate-binding protein